MLIPDRTLIAATGADALALLQKLVTADLTTLEADNGARYTLLLTPQGRYRFDFFVAKAGGCLYLDAPAGQAAALIAALMVYRLRADASFMILPDRVARLSAGPQTDSLCFQDPRHEALGWRCWNEGGADVTDDAYTRKRIAFGIVEPSVDMPANALPLDYALDTLGAISFSKGCYLGQEVTARMHNRGLAKYTVITASASDNAVGTVLAQSGDTQLLQVRWRSVDA